MAGLNSWPARSPRRICANAAGRLTEQGAGLERRGGARKCERRGGVESGRQARAAADGSKASEFEGPCRHRRPLDRPRELGAPRAPLERLALGARLVQGAAVPVGAGGRLRSARRRRRACRATRLRSREAGGLEGEVAETGRRRGARTPPAPSLRSIASAVTSSATARSSSTFQYFLGGERTRRELVEMVFFSYAPRVGAEHAKPATSAGGCSKRRCSAPA